MSSILSFFFNHKLGGLAAAGLGLLVLFGVWQADRYGQRLKGRGEGRVEQQHQTSQANAKVIQGARRVRDRSRDNAERVRGPVDPNY